MAEKQALRVSLVATVLNEAEEIEDLLASIDAQTRAPDEVIMVDAGSTDGTAEKLDRWTRVCAGAQVVSAPGCTIGEGRNRAIERATGEVVAVTDAGVVLDERWLERLVAPLEKDRELDVVSGFFVADPRSVFERAMGATVLPSAEDIDGERFLPSSRSVAFRRQAWERVGGYPVWLDYCEDLVFDLALREGGCRFAWEPQAIAHFRPRRDLRSFFVQYYRYARGDGKADLWRWRHAVRYSAYALGALALASRSPLALLLAAAGGLLYVRRPAERLITRRTADWPSTLLALALIPLIRVTGDIAKMVGYPAGLRWRLRNALSRHT